MRISDWISDVCSSDLIHALVRVLPDAEGASLEISDWRAGPTRQPLAPALPEAAASPRGWTWECDAQLRLVALRAGTEAVPTPTDWEARSLSELFELLPDDDGRFAVLRALARQAGFEGQRARAEGPGGPLAMELAGGPRPEGDGGGEEG